MGSAIYIAKIKRQKAEINEMMTELREEGVNPKVIELLGQIKHDANTLVEALMDKSLIPREHEDLDVAPEVKKIGKKIEKAKERLERIKKLELERQRIEEEIEKELYGE